MKKASIIGATGYTGQELVRMLSHHPGVEIIGLGSQSYIGEPFDKVYPNLRGFSKVCSDMNDPELINEADVIFLALPHGHSVPFAQKAVQEGKKVIDLGADFRLKDPQVYSEWYGKTAPPQELLKEAIYGIPELNAARIKKASLVANPGCYPTTVILPLAPLVREKAIDYNHIIIDSKSGVSGAGRGATATTHYCEVNEDFKAYGVANHRHAPEMEQELSLQAGETINVVFTPHLLPITRGMLSTIYCIPAAGWDENRIRLLFEEFYAEKPFVRIVSRGESPHTRWVLGSNFCDIGIFTDKKTGKVIILSAIDNLLKGASGQAVQNMNIMLGLEETQGIPLWGLNP